MENGSNGGKGPRITSGEMAFLALLGIAGLAAIRWLVQHPEEARRIDMAILLGTQKTTLAISDQCRKLGDKFRYIADKAGTQFNELRA